MAYLDDKTLDEWIDEAIKELKICETPLTSGNITDMVHDMTAELDNVEDEVGTNERWIEIDIHVRSRFNVVGDGEAIHV